MKICANCQSSLMENAKFCAECGQSVKSIDKPFLAFAKDSLHELLDIDGRLWLTLKTLFIKPGLASFEFSQGKRNKYTPPLRLYLVFSLIFFLVLASFQHIYGDGGARNESTTELYSRVMFVLFPIFAAYVGVLFRQSYFLSNLVFSMHIHSMAYVALLVTGPLEALEDRHILFLVLQAVPAGYFLWYVFKAFKTMYQESWLATIVKTCAIYFVYMMTLGLVFDVVLR